MGKLHCGANYAIDSEIPELADLAYNRDVAIHLAQMNIALSEDIDEKQRLLDGRQYVDKYMSEYVNSIQHLLTVDCNAILNTKQELNNRQCYRKFVDIYSKNCFNFNQNLYAFHKLWLRPFYTYLKQLFLKSLTIAVNTFDLIDRHLWFAGRHVGDVAFNTINQFLPISLCWAVDDQTSAVDIPVLTFISLAFDVKVCPAVGLTTTGNSLGDVFGVLFDSFSANWSESDFIMASRPSVQTLAPALTSRAVFGYKDTVEPNADIRDFA
ncbi:unnamed protein product [Medioppia subpectinata]|uniref:Uncharacterized protein n=1 Tax=Medioppia subpectinata TaxID=1979941 RepID=A0A7R9KNU6_9ACAR|nr:unnamed protein product [Medioppia subpectinata]CAG2105624.1 unnamed protein product [Medioppia subpectinata]